MIKSPARAHFQRKMAEQQATVVDENNKPQGSAYELMKAALVEDRRRLHDIQSIQAKIELKQELLPHYDDYVAGVLAADSGANDDVITTLLVWQFDVGNLEQALTLAEYALKHELTMPDQYKRHVSAITAEESATAAQAALKDADAETCAATLAQLERAAALCEGYDMHDQIRAKLHKAIGGYAEALEQNEKALEHFEKAIGYNANIGVKKQIQQLERAIKKAQQDAP